MGAAVEVVQNIAEVLCRPAAQNKHLAASKIDLFAVLGGLLCGLGQAGVALGMAIKAAELGADGAIVRNITLFAVLIYEIVGPYLTKIALIKAGDIKEHERVSARDATAKESNA